MRARLSESARDLLRFLLGRVLTAAGTLLAVTVLTFTAMQLVPGSYADIVLGPQSTPEARAAISERYGLDDPAPLQYLRWLGLVLHGDFGSSLSSGLSVRSELAQKAPVTLEIAALGGVIALVVGLAVGFAIGVAPLGSRRREGGRAVNALLVSVPEILLGGVLVYLFSVYALPLTVGGWVPPGESLTGNLRASLLPAVTVAVVGIGFVAVATRNAVTDTLAQPFVHAATARGASRRQVLVRHLPRNIAVPVLTVFGIYLGYLLGGAVIAETLFSLDGIGRYIVDAARQRDYPALQGGVVVAAAVFICLNMVIDVAYHVIDPRIGARRSA